MRSTRKMLRQKDSTNTEILADNVTALPGYVFILNKSEFQLRTV